MSRVAAAWTSLIGACAATALSMLGFGGLDNGALAGVGDLLQRMAVMGLTHRTEARKADLP